MIYPFVTTGAEGTDFPGFNNTALQSAVDAVASGGEVRLSAGTYEMYDSLRLRSGVTVRGQGEKTILFKPPSIESNVSRYMGVGHFEVAVTNPERFNPGMGVYIYDNHAGGFYSTVATIVSIDGIYLNLSRALCSDIHYNGGGKVVSVFPIVEGYGISDAGITDLVIDGNRQNNAYINGCRGAGVFLVQSDRVVMRNLTVRNFNGDALSFQHGMGCIAENNICEGNSGSGLHPGGGSVAPLLRGNKCIYNDGDGIFYCLRVTYSTCENNICTGNGRNGISIGHRDNNLLIRGNSFENNRETGVYYRPDSTGDTGVSVIFENNTIRGNSGGEHGTQIRFDRTAAQNVCFFGNTIIAQSGQHAISGSDEPESLYLDGNNIEGNIEFSGNGVHYERPAVLPEAGCDLAKPEHARHLGRPDRIAF